jgi:hypothetical protein
MEIVAFGQATGAGSGRCYGRVVSDFDNAVERQNLGAQTTFAYEAANDQH